MSNVLSSTIAGTARPLPETAQDDPIRSSQHLFRVVLDALANPGTVRPLVVHPQVIVGGPARNPWLASVLLTLLDHEVSLHVTASAELAGLGEFLHRRTRVALTDAEAAAFVVDHAGAMLADLPQRIRRGSLAYPDDGATLLIDVPGFTPDAGSGLDLCLTGPGIATERRLYVAGLSEAVLESRAWAVAGYPMGIDLLLIDGAGNIAGLPRTTQVATGKDRN